MECNHITNFSTLDAICKLSTASWATYWRRNRTHRLKKEGVESVTSCNQLKIQASDGTLLYAPMRGCCTVQYRRCIIFLYYFCIPV